MEKLFWGMVGGCTVAFAILLGMYLNKIGVIGSAPESSTEIVSETETETEEIPGIDSGELPSDIQSMIECRKVIHRYQYPEFTFRHSVYD